MEMNKMTKIIIEGEDEELTRKLYEKIMRSKMFVESNTPMTIEVKQ